jgi:hypothetical protein
MRIAFRASQASFEDDGELLVAGVATGGDPDDDEESHYLNLQRDAEGHRGRLQDWEKDGLYIEFDDQGQGDYGVVRECRLGRSMLSVDLSEPIGGIDEVEGFDVELAIDDECYERLRASLPRIVEGTSAELSLE